MAMDVDEAFQREEDAQPLSQTGIKELRPFMAA
jgi:hypothetical protein